MSRCDIETGPVDERAAAPPVPAAAAPARRGLVLGLACTAEGVVGLDTAIVNVAVPSIQQELGVSHATVQWVVVAYGLLLGGFLLFGGRMTDYLGRRRVFLAGFVIFSLASLLAGAASDAGLLIAARGIQGFGAALVAPAALSLLAVTFTEGADRNRALGLFGAVGGAAGSIGVVASGLLTAGPGWRWAFFINVPIGVVVLGLAAAFLPRDSAVDRTTRLDTAGATTVTAGLLAFVYALQHAAGHGWLSGTALVLFAVSAVLLGGFVLIEARSAAPLVPPSTLKNRTLVAANVTAFLAFATLLSYIFIGSLLMQQVLGFSPIRTGLSWLATTVTIVVVAMNGARLIPLLGIRWVLVTGMSLVAVGAAWLARVPAEANYVTDLLPSFLLAGVGFGLCGPALQIGALSGVSESATGLASGLVETMREIGGAAGVAVVATVLVAGSGLAGFHTAFVLITALGLLGVLTALAGFGGLTRLLRRTR